MTISLSEYQSLKSKVESAKADADRASGALERAEADLSETYDCGTLAEAEILLKKLKAEEREAELECDEKLAEFEDRWSVYLSGNGDA